MVLENQMGEEGIATSAIVVIVVVAAVVVIGVYYLVFARGITTQLYDIYPDTGEAPVLEFLWGPPDLQPSQIVRVGPYGVWEGSGGVYENEPATEMEIATTTTYDPVYAPCPGAVTFVERGEEESVVALRYGRNYVVIQHHMVDVPDNIVPGLKVEAGALLGYTQTMPGEGVGFWELELYVKRGDIFRTLPPYDYFSEESRAKLDNYLIAGWHEWLGPVSERSWTVTGENSWTKYLTAPEWWGDWYKTGYEPAGPETLEEFLAVNNLLWVLWES